MTTPSVDGQHYGGSQLSMHCLPQLRHYESENNGQSCGEHYFKLSSLWSPECNQVTSKPPPMRPPHTWDLCARGKYHPVMANITKNQESNSLLVETKELKIGIRSWEALWRHPFIFQNDEHFIAHSETDSINALLPRTKFCTEKNSPDQSSTQQFPWRSFVLPVSPVEMLTFKISRYRWGEPLVQVYSFLKLIFLL